MFCSTFMSGPINQHQPIHVSTRLLLTNHIEAIDSRSEEERSTTEGKKNQHIKHILTTRGISL